MAGARSLWRANGMKEEHIGHPIVAIANSFTQFVPGHVHLHDIGQFVKAKIEEKGCFAAEFNTIAIDDGIAMGHEGMLYSLPSREVIADSVEYMVNAHCADALVCISNCDKITPGMLMAAARLNIPTVFVSGGPMEAGRVGEKKFDLIDAMVMAGDKSVSDEELEVVERAACPTCGSCSGMFTANSMNCLTEALGLGLPGNGTIMATHSGRKNLFEKASDIIVDIARRWYEDGEEGVLPRSILSPESFANAMTLDIAMGGSTNTVLHLLAVARSADVEFTMKEIDRLSRKTPNLCKVAPSSHYHMEDVHRAGGVLGIMGELRHIGLIDDSTTRIDGSLKKILDRYDIIKDSPDPEAVNLYKAAPGGKFSLELGTSNTYSETLDTDRKNGCIRSGDAPYNKDGGLAVLYGNIAKNGSIVKTAGVDSSIHHFEGSAVVFESQDEACTGILDGKVKAGDVVVIRYEGPSGGPGMQEMLYPTSYLKSVHLDTQCALITDGRFSGGSSGLSIGHISPEAARCGQIALLKTGDRIVIDIATRTLSAEVTDEEWERRKKEEEKREKEAYTPLVRVRNVSEALKMYGLLASSADTGAVRKLP